jgi:hypothetical protein
MLFQIEEPDGSPLDIDGPGVAVGIDLSGPRAAVAVAIGGNAEMLVAPEGAGPETAGLRDAAGIFLEPPCTLVLQTLRGLAERALSRPVTHAVLVLAEAPSPASGTALAAAAATSGLAITRILTVGAAADLAAGASALYGAAIAAEDDSFALGRS